MRVLVLNCGSSSVKFAVYTTKDKLATCLGIVENIGHEQALLKAQVNGQKYQQSVNGINHEKSLEAVVAFLGEVNELSGLQGIGHRVVHGGERFSGSVLINSEVLEVIRACNPLAPLHNPVNLLGIEIATKLFPSLPQVAVFDTAFHQSLPKHAFVYPIPLKYYEQNGIRRYGFHGTSHRFVASQVPIILDKPAQELHFVTIHLGNGCSATAVSKGLSVDTTMGLTPLEGLVMGTRSGTIDPGIFFFLNESLGYDFDRISKLLNKESGLLGLSGIGSDMRAVTESAKNGHEPSILAVEIFCYRLAQSIASMVVALPKLNALVFTGGIGENSAWIREKTIVHLSSLGINLNSKKNDENGKSDLGRIHGENSSCEVLVVATNEELLIALDTEKLIYGKAN